MTPRRLFAVLLLLLLAVPASARADGEGATVRLDGAWKAVRGDSAAFAAPGYDDRGWASLSVPGDWETAFGDYDGFGWYRCAVTLPAAVGDAPVGIALAVVGDAFELYWNGVKVGGRGRFPPDFTEAVQGALFLVPPAALAARPGGPHVVAVRVYNDYAYGGLIGAVTVGPYETLAQRSSPRDMVIGGLVSFFLAIGVYHLVFWARRPQARENLYFAAVILAISVYGATFSATVGEAVVEWVNPYRVGLMALLAGGPFFVRLVYALFDLRHGRREKGVDALFAGAVALAALTPLGVLAELNEWIDAALAVGMLALVVRAGRASSPHRPHGRTLMLGTGAFALTFVYDLASEYGFVPVAVLLPEVPSAFWIGFLVFVVAVGIATAGTWALTEVTALVDPLTELSRRHVLDDALRREADRLRRSGGSMALAMVDLDFLKQINDAHGHRVGDEVLARVGRLLRTTARNVDLPARFGGDEFAVLLYDTGLEGATAFAERFRAHLRELRVAVPGGGTVPVSASIGVAVGAELVDPDALMEAADQALYRAKSEGRDQLVGVAVEYGAPAGEPAPRSGGPNRI